MGTNEKTLEMFNYFSDLSEEKIILKKINKESLDELFSGWEKEKKPTCFVY